MGLYRSDSLIINISMFESNLNKKVLKYFDNFIISYKCFIVYFMSSFLPAKLVYSIKCGNNEQCSALKVKGRLQNRIRTNSDLYINQRQDQMSVRRASSGDRSLKQCALCNIWKTKKKIVDNSVINNGLTISTKNLSQHQT